LKRHRWWHTAADAAVDEWHRASSKLILLAAMAVLSATLAGSRTLRSTDYSDVAEPGGTSASEAGPPADPSNSANHMILWAGCDTVPSLTDAQLDVWRARGVTGFACSTRQLRGLGGSQDWTADVSGDLSGAAYDVERAIRDSHIVERAARRGMRMYLTFYLANLNNTATPLADWFDDRGWTEAVLPRARELAAAVRALGFVGVGLDQELYAQIGNVSTATWNWQYPGNTHNEPDVRAKARQRGAQFMQALVTGFPDLEVLAYATLFPETWEALIQKQVNGTANAYADSVQIDFWDGLTSVDGFRDVQVLDAIFFKSTQIAGDDWDLALRYATNSFFAVASRRFSNWNKVSSRVFYSPFGWISEGSSAFEKARDPDYVARQLAAFRRWGMNRMFAVYTYNTLETFDYGPYEAAMREATKAGIVDNQPPDIMVAPTRRSGSGSTSVIQLSGTATDNFAIRAVSWHTSASSGSAELTFASKSESSATDATSRMTWTADVPLDGGVKSIEIEAEDIKGLTTRTTVVID
jgi:hypothetical protein